MGKIAEIMRKKLERMGDVLHRASASFRSKVHTQRLDVINIGGELESMKSSWIRSFAYDNRTKTLFMTVHTGKTYSFPNIDPIIAQKCMQGQAKCKSTGSTNKGRWWVNKSPSLGAAYWKYLRTQLGTPTPVSNPYFDILTDVSASDVNYGYIPKGKGRPTKAEDKQRRFGRLNKRYAPKTGVKP